MPAGRTVGVDVLGWHGRRRRLPVEHDDRFTPDLDNARRLLSGLNERLNRPVGPRGALDDDTARCLETIQRARGEIEP